MADEQTEGGRHEGFRDTAGDCANTGSLLRGNFLEGVENTDHGAEQADKGCGGTDGGERTQTALELGVDDCLRALEGRAWTTRSARR